MDLTPSILTITWNRAEYIRKTAEHLQADPSDFRWYIWDNASDEETRTFISELKDDRIVKRVMHHENAKQAPPWHWFLENCEGDICGKLDDDIRGPSGWPERFASIVASDPMIGLIGGWVYLPEEWDETLAAHKIRTVGQQRIFQNGWVGGCIFLGRRALLQRFSPRNEGRWGTPIDHMGITKAGYVSGYPLPIPFAENLDDPRSPHCRMNRPGGWNEFAAYSARMRAFTGPEEYGDWIAQDARLVLTQTIAQQLRRSYPSVFEQFRRRAARGLKRIFA